MAFFKLLQRLFGGSPAAEISPDPFRRETSPPAAAPEPKAPAKPTAVVQREEIIDGRSRIAGYRFNLRRLSDGRRPDAGTALALLAGEAIPSLTQRRLALVSIAGRDWKGHDYRQLIGPGTAFLVDPPAPGSDEAEWLAVLADIRAGGGKTALGTAAIGRPAALDLADYLVVDFADYSLEAFEQAVADIRRRHPQLQLLADNIQSWPEHRLCQARGIQFSLGEFATQPDTEDDKEKVGQSRLVLIELLNLLRRDADAAQLAEVAKRDPAVAVKVVSMANSPASGLGSPVASVDQAILVLGRAYLYRWLTVSMFRVGGGPRDEGLLEVALRRARFLELLAQERFQKKEGDELFLVGLLSLVDILLGIPLARLPERIALPAEVADVLVRSDGPYARYLMLALAMEKGRTDVVSRLADQLAIDPETIAAADAAARRWVAEALGQPG